jgi:23S rRNA pseudouridine1911/1915/1917 synthase
VASSHKTAIEPEAGPCMKVYDHTPNPQPMKSPPGRSPRPAPHPRPAPKRAPHAGNSPSPASPAPPLPERGEFTAPAGSTLAAALRAQLPGRSWADLRRLVESGKISVDDRRVIDPATRLAGGEQITWRMSARDVRRDEKPAVRLVHEDPHLVVIDKPSGVSTVPFDEKETGTAMDLVRDVWRLKGRRATATPLFVVHRIDKDTSGLLVFAKTKLGERGLHHVFKRHLADREYLAVAEGAVRPGRIESRLVADRGDGIRGSTRFPDQGQHAITHVRVEETMPTATLCRVRLETGRTHQIRIHLSESGHPLVGETVYIRDLLRQGRKPLPSTRLLLHATTLGFEHPVTHEHLHFESPLPDDYTAVLERLRR